MSKKGILVLVFLFALFSAPAALFAEAETHDGFYLNFQLGAGSGKTVLEDDPLEMELTGTSGVFRVKAGYALFDNFIVYGLYGVFNQNKPNVKVGSLEGPATFDATYYDFGGGVCYYFMPRNLYISGDVASTTYRWSEGSNNYDSGSGISYTLSVGKEWWVSENWGLGVALIASKANISKMGDFGGDKFSHTFYGIAFTATYN